MITYSNGQKIKINKKFYDHIKKHKYFLFYREGFTMLDLRYFNYDDLYSYLCDKYSYKDYLNDMKYSDCISSETDYYDNLKLCINRINADSLHNPCFYNSVFYSILLRNKYITEIN
jgi:hypothetical protein